MTDDVTSMSDAELNEVIMSSEPTESADLGESENSSVSPIIEDSNEQPNDSDVSPDVDQITEDDEDSDDDSTTNDQTEDNEDEAVTEDDESNSTDTDPDEDKDQNVDDNKSNTTEAFQPLKANGKEYPIDTIDELYKLASAGIGAQQKYQAIAGHKKSIMAADKAGVDIMEAVNFMADYKGNPQEAIARLLKENNIDPLDIDINATLSDKKDHSVSDFEVKYDEVIGEIGNSPVFPQVQELLLNGWDEKSRDVFLEDPGMIRNLHEEMSPMEGSDKSMFDLVSPIADKMKLSGDTRSDYDIYMAARTKKVEEFKQHDEIVKTTSKPKAKPDNRNKKKAASSTGGSKAGAPTLDFASMSDAELDAFLDKV